MQRAIKIPLTTLTEVADIIMEHEIPHEIVAADESTETITLELTYDRDERSIIHAIEDLIEDYKEDAEG